MKKVLLCLWVYLMLPFGWKVVLADEANAMTIEAKAEAYISGLYQKVDFGKYAPLQFEVFDKAMRGFLNLKNAGKLTADKNIITICDFSLPSTANRMWIIDLDKKKVLFNTYVAHGQGSGEEYATSFSNRENTHKSSLGFYVTGETYDGEHGTSLRLMGMDDGFNDAAFDRGIVVHGADYVSDRFINTQDRLGRSWGCPAVPSRLSLPVINTIKEGTCLFIYAPEKHYMATAYWLNKKITALPNTNDMFATDIAADHIKPGQKVITIQYMTNGKVDSVKTVPVSVN